MSRLSKETLKKLKATWDSDEEYDDGLTRTPVTDEWLEEVKSSLLKKFK